MESATPAVGLRRGIALGGALSLGLAGQGALTWANSPTVGALLLAAAALAAGVAVGPATDLPRPAGLGWRSWIGILALFGVALAIRLYQNGSYPPGIFYDEAVNGLEAIRITNLPGVQLWSEALSGRPTLHLYALNAAFRVFGVSPETLRGVSAFGGALAVVFTFLAAREILGTRGAWIAGLIMLASRWNITFSRIAYEAIWSEVFATATIWLLAAGVRRRSGVSLTLAGIPFALGLYTYVAYRLFAIPVGLFWIQMLAQRRSAAWRGAVGFLLAGVLFGAPMLRFAYDHPDQILYRFQEVSIARDIRERGSYEPLVESLGRHLGMFNYRSQGGARHNALAGPGIDPGAPQFSFPLAVGFVLGLGALVRQARRPERAVLLWTLAGAVAASVSTLLMETPHPTRAILAPPVAAMAAALTIESLLGALPSWKTRLPRISFPAVQAASVVVILGAVVGLELLEYSRQVVHSFAYPAFQHHLTAVARYVRSTAPGSDLYVSEPFQGFPSDAIFGFINYPRRASDWPTFSPAASVPASSQGRPVSYVLTETDAGTVPFLKYVYPNGNQTIHRNPPGAVEFVTYDVPVETMRIRQGVFARYESNDQTLERIEPGIDTAQSPPPISFPLTVEWRGTVKVDVWGNYKFRLANGMPIALTVDETAVGTDQIVPLAAGAHSLQVKARLDSAERLQLLWARGDAPFGGIPPTALFAEYRPPVGFETRYYWKPGEGDSVVAVELTPSIAVFAPKQGFGQVVWRGEFQVPADGTYAFSFAGDDYGSVAVDGRPVIDTKGRPPSTRQDARVPLTAGPHRLEVQLVNQEGAHGVGLQWQPPGQSLQPLPILSVRPIQGPYP